MESSFKMNKQGKIELLGLLLKIRSRHEVHEASPVELNLCKRVIVQFTALQQNPEDLSYYSYTAVSLLVEDIQRSYLEYDCDNQKQLITEANNSVTPVFLISIGLDTAFINAGILAMEAKLEDPKYIQPSEEALEYITTLSPCTSESSLDMSQSPTVG